MNKYSKLLAENHSLSRLCVDREKLETSEILGTELVIQDCDYVSDVTIGGQQTTFSVYVFKEFPDRYVYGGMKLTDIAQDIISMAEKDNVSIADMDIHIMLKSVRTKGNNDFTDVLFI